MEDAGAIVRPLSVDRIIWQSAAQAMIAHLGAIDTLKPGQAERLRAHPDDVYVEQARAIRGRPHAEVIPQQRRA